MDSKTLIILAGVGLVAFMLLRPSGAAAVGKNGQLPASRPPPPPPPPPAPVRSAGVQPGGNWLNDLSTGVGIVGTLSSIWGNLGGGPADEEDGFTADY